MIHRIWILILDIILDITIQLYLNKMKKYIQIFRFE